MAFGEKDVRWRERITHRVPWNVTIARARVTIGVLDPVKYRKDEPPNKESCDAVFHDSLLCGGPRRKDSLQGRRANDRLVDGINTSHLLDRKTRNYRNSGILQRKPQMSSGGSFGGPGK
jgi:hypothetical protein